MLRENIDKWWYFEAVPEQLLRLENTLSPQWRLVSLNEEILTPALTLSIFLLSASATHCY